MECPKCHEKLEAVAMVPDEQRFSVELQFDGPYLSALTLAGVIENTSELLMEIAKNAGTPVAVFIHSVKYERGSPGIARVELLLCASSPHPTSEP